MDAKFVFALPGLQNNRRSAGRVQRQVHVQSVRPSWRLLRHLAIAHPPHLPKLFPTGCPLAILGNPPRQGCSMNTLAPEVCSADRQTASNDFLTEAVFGLSQPQKALPCRFLYDEEGSSLFDQITTLEEYYPTRTETRILKDNVAEIVGLIGRDSRLI